MAVATMAAATGGGSAAEAASAAVLAAAANGAAMEGHGSEAVARAARGGQRRALRARGPFVTLDVHDAALQALSTCAQPRQALSQAFLHSAARHMHAYRGSQTTRDTCRSCCARDNGQTGRRSSCASEHRGPWAPFLTSQHALEPALECLGLQGSFHWGGRHWRYSTSPDAGQAASSAAGAPAVGGAVKSKSWSRASQPWRTSLRAVLTSFVSCEQ